jgi:hypothetical protein
MPVLIGRIRYWPKSREMLYMPFNTEKEDCIRIKLEENVKVTIKGAKREFLDLPSLRQPTYYGNELLTNGKHLWLRLGKQDKEKPVTA